MKRYLVILSLLLLWILPLGAQQTAVQELEAGESQVDVKGIIFEHLKDSYEWHIITVGDRELAIHLPVIIYSKLTGWHFFMSGKLKENGSYQGFHISHSGATDGKLVETWPDGTDVRPLDLSLTKVALGIIVNSLILLVIVMYCARWYRSHDPTDAPPKGFVGLIEYVAMMIVDDVIKPAVGKDYRRFAPLLLTLFFFILLNNLMGLIPIFPAGANVTGNIAVTLTLALVTFFTVNVLGTKDYWKEILWPDVPLGLKCPVPLMPLIEIFGIFTKPFSLTVRLFANMTAGHSIILALTCVIFITGRMGPLIGAPISLVSILFMVFMNCLELLVAFIQAYMFTMLSSLFIGMSRVREKEKEKND